MCTHTHTHTHTHTQTLSLSLSYTHTNTSDREMCEGEKKRDNIILLIRISYEESFMNQLLSTAEDKQFSSRVKQNPGCLSPVSVYCLRCKRQFSEKRPPLYRGSLRCGDIVASDAHTLLKTRQKKKKKKKKAEKKEDITKETTIEQCSVITNANCLHNSKRTIS